MTSLILAPSILAADYARFGDEARRAERAGGDWLHVDIMDGHFVPNISFGPEVTAALKRSTQLPLDVHLMIIRPDLYLDRFIKAGAARITVHLEAVHDVAETLRRIRAAGLGAGLALNPKTPWAKAAPFLDRADLVLCMTVEPGFGGQTFMADVLEKVRALALHPARKTNPYRIEVDGGIDAKTATQSAAAGADTLVAGTSLFAAADMAAAVATMRRDAADALARFAKSEGGTKV
ncbi:MAG: ribulose-phosphate 3-epimerase [Verrucomicrobiae bacterium]|nr:ribulose-phosphate 3-epimerase [Verrucomicrobiae bacterium]